MRKMSKHPRKKKWGLFFLVRWTERNLKGGLCTMSLLGCLAQKSDQFKFNL